MSKLEKILLVDDDPGVRASMKMWLEGEGLAVVQAQNSQEAVCRMREEFPQICLVDLFLKDEDGIELAGVLNGIDDTVPIIIMTAFPAYETATSAFKTGVYDYLSKSADNENLLEKIRMALNEHQQRQSKREKLARQKNRLVLICSQISSQTLIRTFCHENPEFHLQQTFSSIESIQPDENQPVDLLLVCANCFLSEPEFIVEHMRRCRSAFPNARIVSINANLSEDLMTELFLQGIHGFLGEEADFPLMKKALSHILDGELWISRKVSSRLLHKMMEISTNSDRANQANERLPLTEREKEILKAMCEGLSNLAISEKLFISEKTVKTHINNIFRKINVKSRTHAVIKALEYHIV